MFLCILLAYIFGFCVLKQKILRIQKPQNKLPAGGSGPTKTSSVPHKQGINLRLQVVQNHQKLVTDRQTCKKRDLRFV